MILPLELERPPLTANQRMHWRQKAEITRAVRQLGYIAVLDLPKNQARISVGLTWVVKDARRRDVDNIVPTLKALCDGIVDAGVVPDDTPEFMVKTMPEIRLDRTVQPHLELIVEVLP